MREHGFPGLAAVGGLVQPPVAARLPERSLSGHVNHVRVPGVDENLGDVLRVFQPHLGEAGAAVDGFVKSIAIAHAALAVVLAGTHPDDQVVVGINADTADRVRTVAIEDRRPGRAGIPRLPHASRCGHNVPGAPPGRIDGDVAHPARHERRTDAAQRQTRINRVLSSGRGRVAGLFLLLCQPLSRRPDRRNQSRHHDHARAPAVEHHFPRTFSSDDPGESRRAV